MKNKMSSKTWSLDLNNESISNEEFFSSLAAYGKQRLLEGQTKITLQLSTFNMMNSHIASQFARLAEMERQLAETRQTIKAVRDSFQLCKVNDTLEIYND